MRVRKMRIIIYIAILYVHYAHGCYEDPTTCDERIFGRDSFVCVCDGEYCDIVGDVSSPPLGRYKRVVSSRDMHRFHILEEEEEKEKPSVEGDNEIIIDYDTEYQTILGFGGAFTDSAGIAITSLTSEGRENLMRDRFSTHPYSYDEVENDVNLEHFALTREDLLYKIPLIHQANEVSGNKILYFGSPWSPPPWMKQNGKHNGKGGLLKTMWDAYSNYLIRFVEEYERKNVSLWGLTTLNDPIAGFVDWPWNACAISAEDMRDWIRVSFGPALEKADKTGLKIMVHDQARQFIPSYPATILRDNGASKYVDGVAIHWYLDFTVGPEGIVELHNEFQDKFILYTEACEGPFSSPEDKVQLGSWGRAENYSSSIIENINHYSSGWVDWNIALNTEGGPNWANNAVDAPIIVNEKTGEFYKQPMFYAMGHFSKFVKPGSKRLHSTITGRNSKDLKSAAFINKEANMVIVVILNKNDERTHISFRTPSENYINIWMFPKSIETILVKIK